MVGVAFNCIGSNTMQVYYREWYKVFACFVIYVAVVILCLDFAHTRVCGMRWVHNTTNNILDTKTKPKRIIIHNTKTSTELGINKNISHTTITLPNHAYIRTHKRRVMEINTSKTTQNINQIILKHSHTYKQKRKHKKDKKVT